MRWFSMPSGRIRFFISSVFATRRALGVGYFFRNWVYIFVTCFVVVFLRRNAAVSIAHGFFVLLHGKFLSPCFLYHSTILRWNMLILLLSVGCSKMFTPLVFSFPNIFGNPQ